MEAALVPPIASPSATNPPVSSTRINFAPVSQVSWGPNLLPGVLYSGEQITIDVACRHYGVQVWDHHNRSCILSGLNLCFSDQLWTVDNYTLWNCGY